VARISWTARQVPPKVRTSLLGVSAIAVLVASCTSTNTVEPSPSLSAGRFTDARYGWSVTVPPSLHLPAFSTPDIDRGPTTGVSVSNFETHAIPNGDGLHSLASFPATGVMFMLWRNEGGLVGVNSTDDTPLPLSLSGYPVTDPYVGGTEPNPFFRSVVEGGGWFASAVWIGSHASEADRGAIKETVRSVTFPELHSMSVSPEANAIVLGQASTYAVGSVTPFPPSSLQAAPSVSDFSAPLSDVGFYLVHGIRGFYAVPMTAQRQDRTTCRVSADPSTVSFSCANGAKWNRYVHAVSPPAYDDGMTGFWLYVAPATTSWDSHVLVGEGNNPQSALAAWGDTSR
jgi:hypothetical protein